MGPEIVETLAPFSGPGHLEVSLRKSCCGSLRLLVAEHHASPGPGQAWEKHAQGLGLVFIWEIDTFSYLLQHLECSPFWCSLLCVELRKKSI